MKEVDDDEVLLLPAAVVCSTVVLPSRNRKRYE